jgi:hypothetical protein
MAMSPENRAKLLAATREAAAAFIEDIAHIREISNRANPDRRELRTLSGILRRLLIDNGGDLRDITAPRLGRFTLLAPDNKAVYAAEKKGPYPFFGSGGGHAFGAVMRAAMIDNGAQRQLDGFDPDAMIELRMDNFLSQHVLCFQGIWATRRDAIKHMANIASGVHSGAPKEEVDKALARIRRSASYSNGNIIFKTDALEAAEPTFQYEPGAIDPVLFEMQSAAYFMSKSPNMDELERLIRDELSSFPGPQLPPA